jgi:CO/xanthine dehydrogenase Mo-binding subunit
VLPSVTWVLAAMKDTAPLLPPDLNTDSMGKKADKPSNVAVHLQFDKGNIEDGFKLADIVVEREFRTASMARKLP